MSETKHTPGPWKISHGCLPGDRGFSVISDNAKAERVKMVAECWPPLVLDEDHAKELFANARLIASAPDLLDKYNRLRSFASAAVIAFGSDAEAKAIGDLGKLLAEEE